MIDQAAATRTQTNAPASTPSSPGAASTPANRVTDTVTDIRNKLKDGGCLEDDVTNSELKDISASLKGLPAGEANQAVSQLSDAEINKIADEIDSSGIGNFGGLSKDEKRDFVGDLAGKLDAKQFERVSKAFDDPQEIGDIVAAQGSNDAKIGFIDAHKADASNAAQPPGFLDSISGTTHYGNESARAIGTVLGSMDAQGLKRAIGSSNPTSGEFEAGALSQEQLRSVVDASMDQTSNSGGVGAGGASLPSYSFDATRLNKIVDAAATSSDAGLKAEVFQAASKSLENVQGVGGLLTPSVNAGAEASLLADHMGTLLKSDARSIVDRLEAIDSTGNALTPFTRQQLDDGKTQNLHELLSALRNGPNGDAAQYLKDPQHAQDLGYALGATAAGLNSLDKSKKEEAELLGTLINSAVGNLPYGGDAITNASQAALSNTIGAVSSGAKDAPAAFYELMVKGMAPEAQTQVDAAMSRVINLQDLK